jgi:hypothetical protein
MCNYGIKRCYLIRNNYANTSLKKLDNRVLSSFDIVVDLKG